MLILNRYVNESIIIGKEEQIEIKILRIKNGGRGVSVGISAPIEIPIDRKEVLERRKARKNMMKDEDFDAE